ncbi:MAG: hypothetical protein AB8B65_09925 [Kordia sp.]|uniref:hypothetical protein n=1 Tax=Kordia sp. TaxID=1965332 RepID=UPI00385F992C
MKQVKLERYFKLFTNTEAESFFDNSLKTKQIHFVKREIPDSKFTEYFFHEKDLPYVEKVNERLKEKETKDTEREINTLFHKSDRTILLLKFILIALIIAIIISIS